VAIRLVNVETGSAGRLCVDGHLNALCAGEAIIIHLMHGERQVHPELSMLKMRDGVLLMQFEHRLETA
jgi:hypothetical protein